MKRKFLIIVTGPTASGKSEFSVKLAERIGGYIINADSVQLYKDLFLLSSCPTQESMRGVQHHLYKILDANEEYDVFLWIKDVREILESNYKTKLIPIIVGGSVFYLHALINGLCKIPLTKGKIIREVFSKIEVRGTQDFYQDLVEADPQIIRFISKNDKLRIGRAWCVLKETGYSITEWWKLPRETFLRDYEKWIVLLNLTDNILSERVKTRSERIFKDGGLNEVNILISKGINSKFPITKAIGFREISSFLRGEISQKSSFLKTIQSTRNYIKYQKIWFRNRIKSHLVVENDLESDLLEERLFKLSIPTI